MATASDVYGVVFERGSAVLLARVVDAGGDPVRTADVASVYYSVYELPPGKQAPLALVPGHEHVSLSPSNSFFDDLQATPEWSLDAIGYNFRHELDVSVDDAFPNAGSSFQVRYEVQPTNGQKVIFRFLLKAI